MIAALPLFRRLLPYTTPLVFTATLAVLSRPLGASSMGVSKQDREYVLANADPTTELTSMSESNSYPFIKYHAKQGEPVSEFTVVCEELEADQLLEDSWGDSFSELNGVPADYTASLVIESCQSALDARSGGISLGAPGAPYIVDEQLKYFDMLILSGFDGTAVHVVPEGEGGNL